jgi:hypothetical protein
VGGRRSIEPRCEMALMSKSSREKPEEASLRPEARKKFFFCFTLDTEPDNLWEPFTRASFEHFARLYDFHRALSERGAKPVYLTTSEVAECRDSARVMERILETGQVEIGAHFHSWTRNWPFDVPSLGSPPLQAMAHQLGQSVEERMLQYTCDSLQKNLGVRPLSYRGGRWSLNQDSVHSLRNSGILVDTTVTPGRTWQDRRHPYLDGPDFRQCPRHPFYYRVNSMKPNRNTGDILEIPVGSSYISAGRLGKGDGQIGRLTRKLYSLSGRAHGWLWLRPTSMSTTQLRVCLESLRHDQIPVWVAMIHSSEIVPCQPFPTEIAIKQFIKRCLQLVEIAVQMGATCATLDEVRQHYGHPAQIRRPDFGGRRGRDGYQLPPENDGPQNRGRLLRDSRRSIPEESHSE